MKEANILWTKREVFINFLQNEITELYQKIAGSKERLTLKYSHQKERYEDLLTAHRDTDIRMGSTSVGPHRDDFLLFLDERELAEFGSRGESRSAILSLKVAQIHYMESETKQKPLLLLDDVFSELDDSRQLHLATLLKDYQSIITTTSLEHVKGLRKAQVYTVKEGKLEKN